MNYEKAFRRSEHNGAWQGYDQLAQLLRKSERERNQSSIRHIECNDMIVRHYPIPFVEWHISQRGQKPRTINLCVKNLSKMCKILDIFLIFKLDTLSLYCYAFCIIMNFYILVLMLRLITILIYHLTLCLSSRLFLY